MGPVASLALAATAATLPFQLAFTDGRCRGCEAQGLGGIAFSDGEMLWASGFTPPGAAGEGEWYLLSSRDGGRSWRELPRSWSHNIPTRAFFATRRDGWIAVPNGLRLEAFYASTSDGGRRWRTLHVPSSYVVRTLYRGGGRGAAFANDQYAGKSTFFDTSDNGLHWRSNPIGGDMWVDALAYAGPETPVLAGCAGHQAVILASPDEGRSWARTAIPQVSSTAETIGCEAAVDGLAFPAGKPGFALVVRHSFPLAPTDGYASMWRTRDGGRGWSRVFFERYPHDEAQVRWFSGPYALGDLILAFESTDTTGAVLYSRDEGESWSRAPLPAPLSGCFETPRTLTCTVGPTGFRMATLTLPG